MKLRELRAELPDWTWRAVRQGMGWEFEGTKGERQVRVYAVAVIVGEDEFETQWRVGDETYASFWMRESAR